MAGAHEHEHEHKPHIIPATQKISARHAKRSSSQNTKYRTHTRTHQTKKKKFPPEKPAQHVGDRDRPCLGHTYPGKVALGPTDRATITTGSEARKTQVTAALRSASGHVYCPRFRVEKIAHTNIHRPAGRETSPVEGWREYELARLVFQVGYEGGFVIRNLPTRGARTDRPCCVSFATVTRARLRRSPTRPPQRRRRGHRPPSLSQRSHVYASPQTGKNNRAAQSSRPGVKGEHPSPLPSTGVEVPLLTLFFRWSVLLQYLGHLISKTHVCAQSGRRGRRSSRGRGGVSCPGQAVGAAVAHATAVGRRVMAFGWVNHPGGEGAHESAR